MKKFITYFPIIFLALFTISYSLFPKLVFSQTPPKLDLTISPPVLELNAKPGDTIKEKFRVRNNLSNPITLSISAKKLTSSTVNGEPVPQDPGIDDEFIKWVKFDTSSYTAMPKEWKDVNFTIEIPKNASYGYYYVFRIAQKEIDEITGIGAGIKGEVLIPTLLNVKKEGAKAQAKVLSFKTKSSIIEYLPSEFEVKIANKGNIHIKPRGNIFIRSTNQKDVATLDINSRLSSVLPNGVRTFNATWDDGFIVKENVIEDGKAKLDNKGKPVTKLVFNWNKLTSFRVGPYTATLLMVFDDGKKDIMLEGSTTFWVIPYKAIAAIALTLAALFLIVKFLLRLYIKREIAKGRRG